ncbi:hypothetical protein [Crocosphaera sp. XPORK-15E]|uniref:hypothetical protein n=1 Tax=Crocosphaera sp. XPORK-15E TaxID=3110247 RepID=UPI002B202C88|nr:hypothetical protein [Crocosphaera sp. XPORK-15E]MEA5532864.1 hypothetical protein [Crocosphaera sp. XPORK-15E]
MSIVHCQLSIVEQSEYSQAFPWLKLAQIPPFIQQSLKDGETVTLQDFRQWVRQQNKQ